MIKFNSYTQSVDIGLLGFEQFNFLFRLHLQ